MRKRSVVLFLFGLIGVLILSACVPLPEQTTGTTVPTVPVLASTPASTVEVAPTAEVSTALPPSTSLPLTATVGAEATVPPATEGTPGEGPRITLDDNGKTVTLQVGQRVLLYLGEGYTWNLDIGDQNVISRVMGVMVIRGAQGLFEARQPGTTTLTANGDPECLQSQPPCAMPSRTFQVTIEVQPAS